MVYYRQTNNIPDSYKGTSSEKYGYVDSEGIQVASAEQVKKTAKRKEDLKKLQEEVKRREYNIRKKYDAPEINRNVYSPVIPDSFKGTSSEKYGYVDTTGKQIATANKIKETIEKNRLRQ